MKFAFESFEKYSLNEKKGDLKKLVGKEEDEELTLTDAKKIGKKVANMEGTEKRKYVGIINFLGASCKLYNKLWSTYKQNRDDD